MARTVEEFIAKVFSMSDAAWERHANPLSVRLNRKEVPVPEHHRILPNILSVAASTGMVLCIYGVVRLHMWPTIFGIVLTYMAKSWFLDRMVWLYEDMKYTHAEYGKWLY